MNSGEKSCLGCKWWVTGIQCEQESPCIRTALDRYEPKPTRPEVPRGIFCWSTEISEDLANRRLVMLAEKINEILYYITSLYRELDEMKEGKK